MKIDLKSMKFNELEDMIVSLGEKKFRAAQIYPNIFKNIKSIDDINNIPKSLKEKLSDHVYISDCSIYQKLESKIDDTKKYLLELDDKNIVEAVLMKYKHGYSICISSQVGCRMGCSFCASTIDGLVRDLTAGEMIAQIMAVQADIGERISNVVIMGSGEPFDNYDNLIRFLEVVHQALGLNIGYRHITVSTCGIVPKIYELAKLDIPVNLAISLHETDSDKRLLIMPVEKAYNMESVIKAARHYADTTKRRVTFEFAVIKGINDSKESALKLAKLLRGIMCHVNIIPVNPVKETSYKRPDEDSLYLFQKVLKENNINATIRREMGKDINGACGQLRRSVAK